MNSFTFASQTGVCNSEMDTSSKPCELDFSFGDFSDEEIVSFSSCHGEEVCGVEFLNVSPQRSYLCKLKSDLDGESRNFADASSTKVVGVTCDGDEGFTESSEASLYNGDTAKNSEFWKAKTSLGTGNTTGLEGNGTWDSSTYQGMDSSNDGILKSDVGLNGPTHSLKKNERGEEVKTSVGIRQFNGMKEKPTSWSALFKPGDTGVRTVTKDASIIVEKINVREKEGSPELHFPHQHLKGSKHFMPIEQDRRFQRLVSFVGNFRFREEKVSYVMRGLINRGNWCYINATLQVLLGVEPFLHLFQALDVFTSNQEGKSAVPLIDCMTLFINKFGETGNVQNMGKKNSKSKLVSPFVPKEVYDALPLLKSGLSEKGRQEDAEEFLSFLLNGLHDEFGAIRNVLINKDEPEHQDGGESNGVEEDPVDEEDWEHVGPRNRSAVLRKTECQGSLMRSIFGGTIRSSVHRSGSKESASLQPFFTLQLDIQSDDVHNVKEAIELNFSKKSLQGFTCSKTNAEVEAFHKTSLEELPWILILHLKYFVFDKTGGSQKLHKAIEIYPALEIPRDVLSAGIKNRISSQERQYQLLGVVYHHGKNTAGGHYTAAVKRGEEEGWFLCDDNSIKAVQLPFVIDYQEDRVPYLLLYQRTKHVQ